MNGPPDAERRPAGDRTAQQQAGQPETRLDDRSDIARQAPRGGSGRISWPAVVALADRLARGHAADYGAPTLRRVHYLLVASPEARELGYTNTQGAYKSLSDRTARAREAGRFLDLVDTVRDIEYPDGWPSGALAARSLSSSFRYDRSEKLPRGLVLIAEKAGVVPVLLSRFSWLPVTALRGYTSLSHADRIAGLMARRPDPIGLYVGDFDPTGLDIDRDLAARLPFELHRVALTAEQVAEHRLPPVMAKESDSRTAAMRASHGDAVQVEIDALPATILLDLVGQAITQATGVALNPSGALDLPDVDAAELRARDLFQDLSATLAAEGL